MGEKKTAVKQKPGKAETILSIGGAVSAVGLFLLYLLVSQEEMQGPAFWHILQIVMTSLAVACAVGLVYITAKNKKKRTGSSPKEK